MKDNIPYLMEVYKKFYPDFTYQSVSFAVRTILERHDYLDAITLDHYLAPLEYGGLGYGTRYYYER
jgi:hypothetical protein